MICDMSDVTMTDNDNEEEKIPIQLAPTPSASHNPKDSTTGDGHEFEATKSTLMSKTSKTKETSDILKMSEMTKDVKSACKVHNLTKPTESGTPFIVKVAVAEISTRCHEMSNLQKVMAFNYTAVSTHSVSDVRQINMAGNI